MNVIIQYILKFINYYIGKKDLKNKENSLFIIIQYIMFIHQEKKILFIIISLILDKFLLNKYYILYSINIHLSFSQNYDYLLRKKSAYNNDDKFKNNKEKKNLLTNENCKNLVKIFPKIRKNGKVKELTNKKLIKPKKNKKIKVNLKYKLQLLLLYYCFINLFMTILCNNNIYDYKRKLSSENYIIIKRYLSDSGTNEKILTNKNKEFPYEISYEDNIFQLKISNNDVYIVLTQNFA